MKQRTSPRKKGWWLPGISPATWLCCMSALGLLLLAMNFSWAADHEAGAPNHTGANSAAPVVSRIVDLNKPVPKLTTTIDGEKNTVQEVDPKAKITLNGKPAKINDLKSGDLVRITTSDDEPPIVIAIDATHAYTGTVHKAGSGELTINTKEKKKKQDSPNGPAPTSMSGGERPRQTFRVASNAVVTLNDDASTLDNLVAGDLVKVTPDENGLAEKIQASRSNLLHEFWENFRHNLFKPLLLFFYMGFTVPILRIAFEFPHVIYQGLTIYLLLAIGWHGGEELAHLEPSALKEAVGFMGLGFMTNFFIGIFAYVIMRTMIPKMRRVDAATVSAYYGSDSAGTFVTAVGVLVGAGIAYAPFMPVMLAVMEIPGCLVGLYLVSKLRATGMDPLGNMPDEPGYNPSAKAPVVHIEHGHGHTEHDKEVEQEARMALENKDDEDEEIVPKKQAGIFNAELMREVFLNPGLFLLFGGILIGFLSGLQGHKVTDPDDKLFLDLFQGFLCLFLLEMGMTASKRLKDLRTAGWKFIVFGLVAPNIFATTGIVVAHIFSHITGNPLELGTYVLFSVLCGAASYIAVPAIQRLAIPEASPTLPLAASLGLTFSYNVTIGIPVYIMVAQAISRAFPV